MKLSIRLFSITVLTNVITLSESRDLFCIFFYFYWDFFIHLKPKIFIHITPDGVPFLNPSFGFMFHMSRSISTEFEIIFNQNHLICLSFVVLLIEYVPFKHFIQEIFDVCIIFEHFICGVHITKSQNHRYEY